MPRLIRVTTIPASMKFLLKGQLHYMKQNGFDVIAISSDGKEVKELEDQEQCRHIAVPFTRKISPLQDLNCLFKLVKIFRQLKPDIVHTHTPKAGLLGMWAARIAGVPVRMHTVAGLPWMERKGLVRWILKMMEKKTANKALKIYPNSQALRSFLEKEGIDPSKMKVLGNGSSNGIDCNYFSLNDDLRNKAGALKRKTGIANDGLIWISIGRIVADKGIGELLDAFVLLQQQFPNDQLWLLGEEEPELDPLDEKHKNILKDHPSIIHFGFQNDVRPYLAAADVLVFPSYREGFPNVPMQAGAMNCALILSDINGCNEITENGVNGLLVPPKSSSAVLEAMKYLRIHPERRKAFAAAARIKIENNFEQHTIWKAVLQEYHYWLKEKLNKN